jgi:hypothetical protein
MRIGYVKEKVSLARIIFQNARFEKIAEFGVVKEEGIIGGAVGFDEMHG